MNDAVTTPQVIQDEFKKLTEQIAQLEGLIAENKKIVQQCHSRNSHLRETVKILKQKRSEVLFVDRRIHPV